ncbi:hypothetical protein AB0E69_33730 [Kribbella sp. NPDC026611]|uniref:hypothetical protein n=1 Tax=Kribbella sp. NPDC026611 TaxID=3154911 RepID=UPI0034016141
MYDQRLPWYADLQQLADQIGAALGAIAIRPDDVSVARDARDRGLGLYRLFCAACSDGRRSAAGAT